MSPTRVMQSEPKISVIVPVYNAEAYLDRCLKSIYAQTFQDYEIILVNDGSTDHSLEKCREYAEKDSRITVIDKENGGAGSARNAGIEAAMGEYLAFPDVDDWFEPQMYEDLYQLAKKNDYDIVFSGANYYSKSNGELQYTHSVKCEKLSFLSQEACRSNIMKFFPTSTIFDVPWNKLYRREVAIQNGARFSNHKRCQDAMFNLDFYHYVNSAVSTERCYYNYITNDSAGVNRKFPKNYIDINIAYFSHLKELLTGYGLYVDQVKEHYDTSFVIAVYETANMYDNPNWGLNRKGQLQYIRNVLEKPEVEAFLENASIRADEKRKYKILCTKNPKKIIREHKKELFWQKIKSNQFLRTIKNFLDKIK